MGVSSTTDLVSSSDMVDLLVVLLVGGGSDGWIWYLMLERGELWSGSGEAGVYGFVSPCFRCAG